MWNIEMFPTNTSVAKTLFVKEGDINLFARTLSLGTDAPIRICAMARIRRIYQRRIVVRDFPSLKYFYSDITDKQERQWAEMNCDLQVIDESPDYQ